MSNKSIKKEERLIEEFERRRNIISKIKLKKKIKHFHFRDFAQTIIGAGVFSLPALINTSFWDYLPNITLDMLFAIHVFLVLCSVLAVNYQFRDDFPFKDHVYMINFIKRVFFIYVSVMIGGCFMLLVVNKISFDMLMYDVLKNFLAAQSVGLMGAVTFSFFKKDD